ncbi:VanZ family protein [Furfurilactobacillus siliginis]|uniref:Glycopeptide antibiotics resistance protein n=1 Tax=Furfurilactobacillus siliginis TaxID=348151 RepID=A0A0R2L9D8_9LACO|nr:VanZ family protein [Furfurilactobacillus siliginis]KRN96421.1 VanZ family protein [Furfurilactobacillus siliginis]GEK29197.1 glycopeptide antibiotics resistance protein [Furfurilactobacillus siliginis]
MLHQFFEPIQIAIILFPLIAIGMALPLFAYHYHRYGAISRWQVFVNYSFFFYLLCAYFLIILPLPTRSAVAALTTPKYNLHPLLVCHAFRETGFSLANTATWIPTLHAPGFQQPFFNVVLTMPFGFYLHYYFKRGIISSILLSFCLSLFFELTQLSGLYGLYVRPYRLFDVDDLLLNTTGGTIGWLIAPFFTWLLPSREKIAAANAKQATRVGLIRRWTAFLIDWLIIGVAALFVYLIGELLGFETSLTLWVSLGVLIFILLPEGLFNGRTIGLRAVHLQIQTLKWQRPSWSQVIIRNVVCYGALILLFNSFSALLNNEANLSAHPFVVGGFMILAIACFIDFILAHTIKAYPMLFERLSKTTTISSFNGGQQPEPAEETDKLSRSTRHQTH